MTASPLVLVDGDTVGLVREMRVHVDPGALLVRVPA